MLLDFFLLIFIRKSINKKRALNIKTNEIKMGRKKITKMVILNSLNYLIFRFPSALFDFYGLIFRFDKKTKRYFPNLILFLVCKKLKACESLDNLFYLFYIISFIVQFVVFYKYDKNFSEGFKLILTKIKLKFCKKKAISSIIRPNNIVR